MSNIFSGIITPEFKAIFTDAIDSLLETGALTWPCRLIFGDTQFTVCPNCIPDPVTRKSSNKYNGTGPRPFNDGQICPMCNGQSRIPTDNTEDIDIMVIFDSKQFINFGQMKSLGGGKLNVNSPQSYVQSMCKIVLAPKIMKAKELIIDTSTETITTNRYIKASYPEYIGLGASSYILTMWERVG
jgi:hypothetical protein